MKPAAAENTRADQEAERRAPPELVVEAEQEERHDRHDGDGRVLLAQVRRGALLDRARDLLHLLVAGRLLQQPPGEVEPVQNRHGRAREREPDGVIYEEVHGPPVLPSSRRKVRRVSDSDFSALRPSQSERRGDSARRIMYHKRRERPRSAVAWSASACGQCIRAAATKRSRRPSSRATRDRARRARRLRAATRERSQSDSATCRRRLPARSASDSRSASETASCSRASSVAPRAAACRNRRGGGSPSEGGHRRPARLDDVERLVDERRTGLDVAPQHLVHEPSWKSDSAIPPCPRARAGSRARVRRAPARARGRSTARSVRRELDRSDSGASCPRQARASPLEAAVAGSRARARAPRSTSRSTAS